MLLPSLHQVSHHPMVMACHCEGRGWRFSGESNVKSKFWGQTIQLDPVGVLTLEFDDGETFKWSKVRVHPRGDEQTASDSFIFKSQYSVLVQQVSQ